MPRTIKIDFVDFWSNFNKKANPFWNLLSQEYNVVISENPDILFYSYFGLKYMRYNCLKVFYQGENWRPDFKECDYAFSFDYLPDNNRNYRLPLYALYDDPKKLIREKDVNQIIKEKTRFCAFVVTNRFSNERIDFFKKLSGYKSLDSGGKYLNNIGGPVANKIQFIKNYKFTIAFENSSYPGYTTEKIFEPMLVNSIPIYWGNPLIYKDFNPKSFVNCHDFSNIDQVVERIIEIDNDPELYRQILNEPFFTNNMVNDYVKEENILKKLVEIVESLDKTLPVAQRYFRVPVFVNQIRTKYRWIKPKIVFLLKKLKLLKPKFS